MTILITGAAGFIGYHLTKKFLENDEIVIGYDNLNSYYDKTLKLDRLKGIESKASKLNQKFIFIKNELENLEVLEDTFKKYKPKIVINLAAQAGVRYSLKNPHTYISSNIIGFANLLECCRYFEVEHLLYASSSSIYGGNTLLPFSEHHSVDHPISLYAATKKSNELMAHTYSHLFQIPSTGLRFFTAYGPWGRPDMALFLFTKSIIRNEPIQVFNHGKSVRDFTYIDDVIESIYRLSQKIPKENPDYNTNDPSPATSWAPHQVFNIGNSNPVSLMTFIEAIENYIGIEANKIFLPLPPGDVETTSANTELLEKHIGFKPKTSVKAGIKSFIDWYRSYYNE